MRTYLLIYDDGHDYGSMTFKSNHKAGSKKNAEDALTAYRRAHTGHVKISSITLEKCH